MPDKTLIIEGAAKACTTSLANWLGRRPAFSLGAEKEPRFHTSLGRRLWVGPGSVGCVNSLILSADAYERNFTLDDPDQWAVDGSVDYLWCPEAPDRIAEYARERQVKLVCILRDPVARAISEYNHTLRGR